MKSRFLILLLLFLSWSYNLDAQKTIQVLSKNGDCSAAIDITGLTEIHATAPVGAGVWQEFQAEKTSLYSFNSEHHTVWYKFVIQQSCVMNMVITPDNPSNDYDFILFRANGEKTCQFIRKGELKPVRTNISRPNATGQTGLGSKGTHYYVHSGKGNSWSKPLTVKRGEVYYLVLDNVYDGGEGHRIVFSYANCKEEAIELNQLSVNINVKDKESKRLIRANVMLIDESKGYKNYDTIYDKVATSVFIPVEPGRYYECQVTTDGYLMAKEIFKLDSNTQTHTLNMELQAVSEGKVFELADLYFVGGSAQVVRKSYPALRKLLAIMKDNPNLDIEIQGHVNFDKNAKEKKSEEYYQQLSVSRAKTVYQYLSKRGISESRMSFVGFGYSQMIFKNPKTPQQMQRNRRVVVKITKI